MLRRILIGLGLLLSGSVANAAETDTRAALAALERAGAYFHDHLGVKGTYVWRYSTDGRVRRGEGGPVGDTVGWVQPPGTPAVGAAFLQIHKVTGNGRWLEAAREVAHALLETQLVSGGWFIFIETDPAKVKDWCYRAAGVSSNCATSDNPRRNTTVLDDNNTQSALNFLMWFDRASAGRDPRVSESVRFGLGRLMEVQYRSGAVPPSYARKPRERDADAPARATLPEDWPRTWQQPDTPPYYVVNDNLPRDTGRLFLNAFDVYGDPDYLRAAVRVGDFLVAAQLPAPQRGWAQTYDGALQPVWGRKFEPPSVASHETAGSIEFLVELHKRTGDERYLRTAEAAAEWLTGARLPDGLWARFYELRTNRPLYVDKSYQLTFDDTDLPDHYALKGPFNVEGALAKHRAVRNGRLAASPALWVDPAEALDPSTLESRARALISGLDDEGRWLDDGWVDGRRFVDNVFTLSRALSTRAERKP